jgi:hypothetical protein
MENSMVSSFGLWTTMDGICGARKFSSPFETSG